MNLMTRGTVAGLVLATTLATPARAAVGDAELALRWAPIHYQDVDATGTHALGGRSDYLARYDFDGDLDGRDNWDDAGKDTTAHVYYSVVETSTHWYLTYFFFHPRDWVDHPFFETEHENDGEGVLEIVERDGSAYGQLRAAVTVAHSDFYSYTPAGSTWTGGGETVDGTLRTQSSPHDSFQHPVTAQEAKGHGLKAYPQYTINGDGIVYYPSTVAESPSGTNDRDVRYRLVDIFASGGMWAQRANSSLFASLGTFAGDTTGGCGTGTYGCGTNSANAPWGWDDGNDVPARGEIATDPAKLATAYFTVPGSLSRTYTSNGYAVAAAALREAAATLPRTVD
ncbi:hypothetical protein GCM10010168_81510 [Actinoplanes ianthinogenes]|uniref:Uncharacterized protein n=1 Tax=Actinoplanes ianthinogenes TaxID=122358 RepID=A0ABM7LML1_9ACTN|nr:hypothetical protein [Actinoplanes ianthinogenes]BCJ40515.1 hypothetical protein Aiant_11720 [Actinoplanes ianthinogenes]GGR50396.1 hypothetical protein GCM10010168_81510 [Actinoplanes ianthinogenes]